MKDLTATEHKFVNDLALGGTRKRDIAEALSVSEKTIYNSLHRSFPTEQPSKINVRKRKTGAYFVNKQKLDTLLEYVINHPWAPNSLLITECGLPTEHRKTVSRWLKLLGIGSYIACRRQGITPINAQKRSVPFSIFFIFSFNFLIHLFALNLISFSPYRFLFAGACAHWTEQWKSVVFTDEKLFNSHITTGLRVKRQRGQRYDERFMLNHCQLTNVSVNCWGFVAYGFGARLFLAGEHFNSARYQECLRVNYLDAYPNLSQRVFCQDNARFHTSPETKAFFRENRMHILRLAPQSSDANPMENVWALIERQLSHYLITNYINTPADLLAKVQELCEAIPVSTINSLFDSMPKRIAEIRVKRGKATHY